ncbi:hypothetical protein ASPZODRAFT_127176 [Penicilliopsis zonata CBS 506.65]|uniref:Gamma interferon inducible lysosomal thiol reductase GILT n=1 Tax=Penicilliopsis zonata CBS 506.65 TaxID=1073090 RepID=A0A1L9SV91_9EURO|nr:hypothetical protein ASPZODRAFT_127176 [Penicilliopsis zonata CBS 506.65]OJJ51152.1 hypothetical protein ASPZODRAFT_127176 [Penicilliopsis zonata CBS 506.65]
MEKFALNIPEGGQGSIFPRRDRVITRLLRRTAIALLLCFGLYVCVNRFAVTEGRLPSYLTPEEALYNGHTKASTTKIPLEAHIMSKCPDARDCLQQLIVPAMEQISDKVEFQLSMIASVSNQSSEVICKHGPSECIGDMLLLCAANLPFPPQPKGTAASDSALVETGDQQRTPTIRSLGFANCLVKSYSNIPSRELVEGCALEHGIDFDALNQCASQQDDDVDDDYSPSHRADKPISGIALLRESALHSAALSVKTSCTVRVDEKVWCVRDGGVWKDCVGDGEGSQVSVLVNEVKTLWEQRN